MAIETKAQGDLFVTTAVIEPAKRKRGQRIIPHPGRPVNGHKLCPRCGEIKGVTCFSKSRTRACGLQGKCKDCNKEIAAEPAKKQHRADLARASYAVNKDKKLAYGREYDLLYPEKKKARNKKRYAAKREEILAYGNAYYHANRDHYLEMRREWTQQNPAQAKASSARWRADNRQAVSAQTRNYTTAKRNASVSWADQDAIAALYAQAMAFTVETGIKHNVDHMVPLLSKYVCGLHCEANLCVVTESENKSKANRYWPDMPSCLDTRKKTLL